jgi:hypothetical protein
VGVNSYCHTIITATAILLVLINSNGSDLRPGGERLNRLVPKLKHNGIDMF